MKTILFIILYSIGGAVLATVDTYLPFVPPATTTMAALIFFQDYYFLFVIPVGIAMGLGTSFALFGLRRIESKLQKKVKSQKFSKFQAKITGLVDIVGDYAIVVSHSVGLGTPIAYLYVIVENVNYKLYTIYTIIGRVMLLSLFVAVSRFLEEVDASFLVFVLCMYIITYTILIILIVKNRKKFKKIKEIKQIENSKDLHEFEEEELKD